MQQNRTITHAEWSPSQQWKIDRLRGGGFPGLNGLETSVRDHPIAVRVKVYADLLEASDVILPPPPCSTGTLKPTPVRIVRLSFAPRCRRAVLAYLAVESGEEDKPLVAGSTHWSPFDFCWFRHSVYNSIKRTEKPISECIELYKGKGVRTCGWSANFERLLSVRQIRYYLTTICH